MEKFSVTIGTFYGLSAAMDYVTYFSLSKNTFFHEKQDANVSFGNGRFFKPQRK